MIAKAEIQDAIRKLGMNGAEICIHASMHSFADKVEEKAAGIVQSFLACGCTILVPTFTYDFLVKPVKRYMPAQNGVGDYTCFINRHYDTEKILCIMLAGEYKGIQSSEFICGSGRTCRAIGGKSDGNRCLCPAAAVV